MNQNKIWFTNRAQNPLARSRLMMKKILLIYGHPVPHAFAENLLGAYKAGAESAGAQTRVIRLNDLEFEMNFKSGYRGNQSMEPDLLKAQEDIRWADHLVFIYPNWWSTYPAVVKAFIDRTFIPGFAFSFVNGSYRWEKLLTGKTARIIITMDSSYSFYRWRTGKPGHRAIRKGVLEFCGIRPVRFTNLDNMKKASEARKEKLIKKIRDLGRKMN